MKHAKEHNHLDFININPIETGYLLIPMPDEKYKALNEIYDRVCGVIYLASKIGEDSDRACINSKALTETSLRASLSEFWAVGDCLEMLYPDSGSSLWFNEHVDSDPILHMLKLLRNYNVHVEKSELSSKPLRVQTLFDDKTYTIRVHYISNLSEEGFLRVNAAARYRSNLAKMIEVFNYQQHSFGIGCLIMHSVLSNMRKLDRLLI